MFPHVTNSHYEAALRVITREPIIGDEVLLRRWANEHLPGGDAKYDMRDIAQEVMRLRNMAESVEGD